MTVKASLENPSYNHQWLRKWLRGEPHIVLGGDDPYLKRWFVIPRNPYMNLYLHQFCRSDDDRALHDHPWDFWSLILKGAYTEHTNEGPIRRKRFSLAHRKAEHAHRVELDGYTDMWTAKAWHEKPVWTLFFTTRKRREWGFWCPKSWVHWTDFTSGPHGEESLGCGEYE